MRLSIVTINRNNAAGLERTMQSVSSQTYKDLEYVIVDGASTDGSVDVIKKYEPQFAHIKWVSESDKGIYNAMNKGIRMASGEFVMILNSADTLYSPSVVEEMLQALSGSKGVRILLGNIVKDGVKRRHKKKVKDDAKKLSPVDSSMFTFYFSSIPHDAAFIKKDIFDEFGYYDEGMKICSDWKLFLDVVELGGVIPMYVDIDVVLFDMNGISESGGINADVIREERRSYLKEVIPQAILKDYDRYGSDILMMQRLHRHPVAFKMVRLFERCLFKLEQWFGV